MSMIPDLAGTIDRRLLISYRVDAEVLRRFLPPPFRPQLAGGAGVAGPGRGVYIPCSGGKDSDVVLAAPRIPGDQHEVLAARLGDQHPVKRVAVDQRKAPGSQGMPRADGQFPEAAAQNLLGQVGRLQLADGLLDGDFPDGDRADVDIRLMVEPGLDLVGQ
jgi:hypothetical protein